MNCGKNTTGNHKHDQNYGLKKSAIDEENDGWASDSGSSSGSYYSNSGR